MDSRHLKVNHFYRLNIKLYMRGVVILNSRTMCP